MGTYFQTQKSRVLRKADPAKADSATETLEVEQPNHVWQSLVFAPAARHAKLAVSRPDDPYELDADRIADQVMRMTAPQPAESESTEVKAGSSSLSFVPRKAHRKRGHHEYESQTHRKNFASPESSFATAEIVSEVLSSEGRPLDQSTRAFMEPRFKHDFSEVRLHTGSKAEASAARMNALAYTVGPDIVFGAGYLPTSGEGRHLLAHELTHVVQQGGAGVEPTNAGSPKTLVQRSGGPLDQRLNEEFVFWRTENESFKADGNHVEYAYTFRILLLFQGVDGDSFADDAALDEFIDRVLEDADNEIWTLVRTGVLAVDAAPAAFPHIWSGRVYDALHLDADMDALREEASSRQQAVSSVSERIPAEVAESGLPVPFAEASTLGEFHLRMSHVNLDRDHVVKDMALAARSYAWAGWTIGFFSLWNAMVDRFAEVVYDGEVVVNYEDYKAFLDSRQQGLRTLGTRIRSVDTQEMMQSFDADVVSLTNTAFVMAFASMLLGLVPAFAYWDECTRLFDDKMLEVDATIAGESGVNTVLRGLQWAYEAGYFGAAGAQILNSILSHGWQILGMAVGFIIVQYIPFLNIAVDAVVILYSGVDAIQALVDLGDAISSAASAKTAVALQRTSARMASALEGDGLRVLMDLLAISAAAKGIRTKAEALERAGMSEEEALRQALREATGEEAQALRGALARRRIRANYDPHGVLDGLLDRGVNAETVEQALLSGMSPQRLNSLVSAISDVSRAEAIIEYAGSYSSPVNHLLDVGVSFSKIGEVMDLQLGLRDFGLFDVLIARTGRGAQVDGFISTLTRFGADSTRSLFRLTHEGMVSVYQAGGASAMEIVVDTLSMEAAGRIGGFNQWVEFTITRLNKRGPDLINTLGELQEAQRIAETLGPGERVLVSGDATARPGSRSFDLAVEDATGRIVRNVEVTTAAARGRPTVLSTYRDLTEGIRHGIDKLPSAVGAPEVTIRISIRPSASLGAGRTKIMRPDGRYHIVEADGRITTPNGDVLAEAAAHMPAIRGSGGLSQVHVVNLDGTLIGTIVNRGGTWARLP